MFKDYKYSVISKTYITSFSRFLLLSTGNVRMSEGTFCRVEVHIVFVQTSAMNANESASKMLVHGHHSYFQKICKEKYNLKAIWFLQSFSLILHN